MRVQRRAGAHPVSGGGEEAAAGAVSRRHGREVLVHGVVATEEAEAARCGGIVKQSGTEAFHGGRDES